VEQLIRRFSRKRDFYAGGLMVLFGLVMALHGPSYRIGTLMHMGPGFMPTVLGVILTILGILIAATGSGVSGPDDAHDERILPEHPQWWGWFCILAGPVLFIVFGSYGGLAPATFACVFMSALGDRNTTWKGALGLAAFMTAFGVLLFSFVLRIPMPVLEWRGL
jgi:Tripartite tricarboxylate transporter TctB family